MAMQQRLHACGKVGKEAGRKWVVEEVGEAGLLMSEAEGGGYEEKGYGGHDDGGQTDGHGYGVGDKLKVVGMKDGDKLMVIGMVLEISWRMGIIFCSLE